MRRDRKERDEVGCDVFCERLRGCSPGESAMKCL